MDGGTTGAASTAPLARAVALVFVLAVLAALPGIAVPSTRAAHAAVDEPQYLLTALSLAEDADLDLTDELAEARWRRFASQAPPVQTAVLPDGRQVSPHDPLLPVLLALPMGLDRWVPGWVAAKAVLALLAGAAAALTVVLAVRRCGVPVPLAAGGVLLGFASPPLAVYATQVYPELPAALAVLVAALALTGRLGRGALVALGLAVVALPWLGVKYVPVAAVLAGLALLRLVRAHRARAALALAAALGTAGAGYLVVHRLVWGGWTVYATGDHFAGSGEFGVVGFAPDYAGRSLRLVGLLVDRGFGLVPWQPLWLLLVPAGAWLLARRPPAYAAALLAPLVAGWAVATWVALTMHGFWWPGRQLVVVLPLGLVVVLAWLHALGSRALRAAAYALGAVGVLAYAALVADGRAGRLTWVVDAERVRDPLYSALRPLLPDYRVPGFWPLHLAWAVLLIVLAVAGWRTASRPRHLAGSRPRNPLEVGT